MKHQILNSYTKLLLTFILLILSTTTKAQSNNYQYQPMAIEGATWVFNEGYRKIGYHITGDTIINNIQYKKGYELKLNKSNTSAFLIYSYDLNDPKFYMRDDTIERTVYNIFPDVDLNFNCQSLEDNMTEYLLYDFSKNVDDTIYDCTDNYIQVAFIDTVSYFGFNVIRRNISIYNNDQYEKIGQNTGLFADARATFTAGGASGLEHYCIGDIEDCILEIGPLATQEINDNPNLIIYPNPANSEIHFTSDVDLESLAIYSMTGQLVKSVKEINLKDLTIDISNLQSQTYAVLIKQKDGEYIRKIFIKY